MHIEPAKNPSLQALESAVSALRSFNEEHSAGARLGGAIFGIISAAIREEDEIAPVTAPERKPLTHAQSVFDTHQPALSRIGLELSLNQERSDVRSLRFDFTEVAATDEKSTGVEISEQRLSLGVLDAEKLLSFFQSLKQLDVAKVSAQNAIELVASEIDRNIVRAYILESLERGEGDSEALFSVAADISSELQRLGLKSPALMITHHLEHIWQGDLREQLIAESNSILPGDGFRPHIWHIDNTPEMYRTRWDNALQALSEVLENPRAVGIARESYSYLADSLEIAEQYYHSLERSDQVAEYMRPLIPEYLDIVEELKERLEALRPETL